MKRRNLDIFKRGHLSVFYCTYCSEKTLELFRPPNKKRKSGHLKKIYCPHCKIQRNCVEINGNGQYSYQDFLDEYNNGVFNEEGERRDDK